MDQKPIRDFNNQKFSVVEGAEMFAEFNDRTESGQTGYNSIDELATKTKAVEAKTKAVEAKAKAVEAKATANEQAIENLSVGETAKYFPTRADATAYWEAAYDGGAGTAPAETFKFQVGDTEYHRFDASVTPERTVKVGDVIQLTDDPNDADQTKVAQLSVVNALKTEIKAGVSVDLDNLEKVEDRLETYEDETVSIVETQENDNYQWSETLVNTSFTSLLDYTFINAAVSKYSIPPVLVDESEHPFNYTGNALKMETNSAYGEANEFKLVFPKVNTIVDNGETFKITFQFVADASGTETFYVMDITGSARASKEVTYAANVVQTIEMEVVSNDSANYYLLIGFNYGSLRSDLIYIGEHKLITSEEVTNPAFFTKSTDFEAEKVAIRQELAVVDSKYNSKFDLIDINSVVDYKRPLPLIDTALYTVYDDPSEILPTSSITNASTVSHRLSLDVNPIFSYSCDVAVSSSYPYPLNQSTARKVGYLCEFEADTQEIEFKGHGNNTRFRVVVDDVIVTDQVTLPNDPQILNFKIDFGTKQRRNIKLSIWGQFFGINIDEDGEVFAVDNSDRFKFISEGDSTVEGTSASLANMYLFSWCGLIAQKLNYNFLNSAVGGSGYLALGNGGEPNMLDRIQTYVIDENPDVFLASMGYNDLSYTGGDWDTVKSNADTYWDTIKSDLPNCTALVVGVFNPDATITAKMIELNEHLRKAAKRNGFPFINPYELKSYDSLGNIVTDNGDVRLITGTGNLGTPADPIDGNRSYYIIADNIHPSIEMHRFVGVWMTNEIYRLLKNREGVTEDAIVYRDI